MKILVIGGTGTIGKEIVSSLKDGNEICTAGRTSGDFNVDITSKKSIEELFEKTGNVDVIISAAGDGKMGSLNDLTDEDFKLVLDSKVMGQINIVRIGEKYLNEGGSITLTSGMALKNPRPGISSIGIGVAAIDAFVKTAATELEHNKRINSVSPDFVKETMVMMGMDDTYGVSAKDTVMFYKKAVEGNETGKVYEVSASL